MGNYRDVVDPNENDSTHAVTKNNHPEDPPVFESLSQSASFPSRRALRPSLLLSQVLLGFQSLKGSPPELYKAYILKFLDSYAYFSFSIVFTLFLSNDFGFSDVQAGTLYGAWGALVTLYGLLMGTIVDNLGVAKSLQLGFCLSLLARACIVYTTSSTVLLFHICVTLPLGNCLGIPVLTTGIRRYTREEARGFAFGLFYVIMNVAALLSGPIVDLLTIRYKGPDVEEETDDAEDEFPKEWSLTSYRAIILTGILANVAACIIAFTVREIKVEVPISSNAIPNSPGRIAVFSPKGGTFQQVLCETCNSPSFRRFLLVCLITLNVRMIFRHLDATLPKYMVREFGEDVPKGTIYSINPALIILLVPLVTAATSNVDPLVMIHFGSYISAASVFALALSTSIGACIVFVSVLSVGEAIWSPRLYDYAMSVCPEGREGTYMALSNAPLFLAKLPVGMLSGVLLQKYCPIEGERHSQKMWLIIGLLTVSSPVLMTVCWNYISRRDEHPPDDDEFGIGDSIRPTGDPIKYTELPQPTANTGI
jgi:POT family proton-dependent oligopeptide transporter